MGKSAELPLNALVSEPSLGYGTCNHGHWDGLKNSEPGKAGTSSSSVTLATSAGGQSLALRQQAREEAREHKGELKQTRVLSGNWCQKIHVK